MSLQIWPIAHIPEVLAGDDLGELLHTGIIKSGFALEASDVVAVTQKVISKAEGRSVRLCDVMPSEQAIALGRQTVKDPRLVEVILQESRRIVRVRGEVLITETHHGFICANAGVDRSNVVGDDVVTLLPLDADRSARRLAHVLNCGIIVTDTFGRPWREGLLDACIGIARAPLFLDFRGQKDAQGYPLQVTVLAVADALAAAAGLVMGKTAQTPAALIRGLEWEPATGSVQSLLRNPEKDLFL